MREWATDANDEACVNEVIGIDIAATMQRRILEGLAEANAHSQRSLYENGIWIVLLCRMIGPFTVAHRRLLVTKREKQALDGSVRV